MYTPDIAWIFIFVLLPLTPHMIIRLLKIMITLIVLAYVGYRLFAEGTDVFQHFGELSGKQLCLIIGSLILMPLNWGMETLKWQKSLQRFYSDTCFRKAWEGVWAGLATGIFTPNRWGEYAGRIAFIPSGYRLEAAIYLFADRFCQLIITVWAGWVAVEWMTLFRVDFLHALIPGAQWVIPWIRWSCRTLGILLFLLVLFPPQKLPVNMLGPGFKPWLLKAQNALKKLDTGLLWTLLGLSTMRYIVFSIQYLLLMSAFGSEISYSLSFAIISIIFLIKSLVPAITLTELGVRESIALYVMGMASISASTAFNSTFFLYMINLLIPSLIGLIFVYRIRRI